MKNKRSSCPISCALDILGDRWTLLLVRDLFLGRKYFKHFLASPEGISSNILSDRLKFLTDVAVIEAKNDPDTEGRKIYALTDKGLALLPMIDAMKDWGLEYIQDTAIHLEDMAKEAKEATE